MLKLEMRLDNTQILQETKCQPDSILSVVNNIACEAAEGSNH